MATSSEGAYTTSILGVPVSYGSLRLVRYYRSSTTKFLKDVQRRSMGEDNRQQVCVAPSSRLWLAFRLSVGRNSLLLIILADACKRLMTNTVIY